MVVKHQDQLLAVAKPVIRSLCFLLVSFFSTGNGSILLWTTTQENKTNFGIPILAESANPTLHRVTQHLTYEHLCQSAAHLIITMPHKCPHVVRRPLSSGNSVLDDSTTVNHLGMASDHNESPTPSKLVHMATWTLPPTTSTSS